MRFPAGLLAPLHVAAAKCCFRVLLLEWCVRCGAGLPVQNASNLQGAAVRVLCVCEPPIAGGQSHVCS